MRSDKPLINAGIVLSLALTVGAPLVFTGCRTNAEESSISANAQGAELTPAAADVTPATPGDTRQKPTPEAMIPPLPHTQENPIQLMRFTIWLDVLDKSIDGLSPEAAVEKLTDGSARNGVFNLQALGRIYEDENPEFKKARKRFKALEDGIGSYAKWNDLLTKAEGNGAKDEVKSKLQTKKSKAKTDLVELLGKEDYIPKKVDKVPYLKALRAFLIGYAWKAPAEDRKFVLKALSDQLEHIKSSHYDFSHLEDGNGVHEFRRKLRWFAMETRSLNGLVVLKDASAGCPVPEYAALLSSPIAKSKYAVLPPAAIEPNPVKVTPCLYVKIAQEIDEIGTLKGDVEEADNNTVGEASDVVGKDDQAKVQAILDGMLKNDVCSKLQSEIAG
ncbi:MAG: hypothetical protein H7249_00270 [Chitinophagaceae bacterium]|nr:hypothetical protein [Oligoflexus sp.]